MATAATNQTPRTKNNFFVIRDKFETLSSPSFPDRRGTISSSTLGHDHGTSSYQLETHTLGRKVTRGSSFSYGTKHDKPTPPTALFPFIMKDRRSHSNPRNLNDSGYDSFTLATPPRRFKFNHHESVDSSSSPSRRQKSKDSNFLSVRLSPAHSMCSLSSPASLASSPASLRSSPSMSSSVFNLSIAPSNCVSQSVLVVITICMCTW